MSYRRQSAIFDAIIEMCFTIFIEHVKNMKTGLPARRRGGARRLAALAARGALVFLTASGFAGSAAAACRDGAPEPEARVVIGLYDSREEPEPRDTRLHRFLELPLNHLGYVIEYWDVANGTPPARLSSEVAAVATWFKASPDDVAAYEAWAATATAECGDLRWMVLGNTGAAQYGVATPEGSAFLARLGIAVSAPALSIGALAKPVNADPGLIGHESDFIVEPGVYRPLRALPGAKTYLSLATGVGAREPAVDLMVLGPEGIYAHASAIVTSDPRTGAAFWVADPFRLIALVLGDRVRPVPDVTTLTGRRLFFATVGSEGWLSVAPALDSGRDPKIAVEILRDRVILPHGDLPQTVAVLGGDLKTPVARKVAEQLFALDHVQIGSNGDSFIRNWSFFERYDRAVEMRRIDESARSRPDETAGLVGLAVRNLAGAVAGMSAGADMPANALRKYAGAPFDLDAETTGAITAAERLAPSGKPASLYIWTGDSRPFPAALARVRRAGHAAIGGGGGVYNRFAPSLSNLQPFAVAIGPELQVYDALSGDSAYTGFWTAPIEGFHMLAQTVAATETPRRLKPFHLSYSVQSMIHHATRSAIGKALELARTEPVIPITAVEYVRIIEGFATFRAEPQGPNRWRILNRGDLQTVRFDGAADLALDMTTSRGVLGARRKDDALYVALSPAAAEPLIALTGGRGAAMRRDPSRFGLVESRLRVDDLEETPCGIEFRASGWGAGTMTWEARPATSYRFILGHGAPSDAATRNMRVASGADGRLHLAFPPLQGQSVRARLEGGC